MNASLIIFIYLIAAVFFILGLKSLGSVKTARRGNLLSAAGMLLAVSATLVDRAIVRFELIIAGVLIGTLISVIWTRIVKMTEMPQMVALYNGFGGGASALVAASEYVRHGGTVEIFGFIMNWIGVSIGTLTLAGSLVAYSKLQGLVKQAPVVYRFQNPVKMILVLAVAGAGIWLSVFQGPVFLYWSVVAISFLLGILIVIRIGGADMPVVISLLNAYSGLAAAFTGFVLMNEMLIVAGALVGASGIILTTVMCKAMNRSILNVAFGAFGKAERSKDSSERGNYQNVKSGSAEEAAMILAGAQSVVIVPGYGMAVSHAQHAVWELTKILTGRGATVKFAVHPVAGRMPGHMNVLLAEAQVPYEQIFEMETINPEFPRTDAVIVIGANDVTNPAARQEPGSPIYGMPILDVDKARSVIVVKRSLSPGFAGIKNPLFEASNVMMYYEDAKGGVENINRELKEL